MSFRATQAKGPAVSNAVGGGGTPSAYYPYWREYIVNYTDLANAGSSNSITLFSLTALGIIQAVKVRPVIQFAGIGMTYFQVSLGDAGSDQALTPLYDVFNAAPSATERQLTDVLYDGSSVAGTNILLYGETNLSLNLVTAGQLSISVLWGLGY